MLPLFLLARSTALAGDALWNLNPGSVDWNTAGNWTPATVPNGTGDTAFFAASNTMGVSVSGGTTVDGIIFAQGASAYTITASPTFTLTISGAGITNNSGTTQSFATSAEGAGIGGQIFFTNSATAANGTFTNNAATVSGGQGGITEFINSATAANGSFNNNAATITGAGGGITYFFNSATAANATFTNSGATGATVFRTGGGVTSFNDTSTAGNGTFNNSGAAATAFPGETDFNNNSTAANGTFSNSGGLEGGPGGVTSFNDTSTAGNATLFEGASLLQGNGGVVFFRGQSDGGTARVDLVGGSLGANARLDISGHDAPGVAVGSIEGLGVVILGANNLTVGSNNLSTAFSGEIFDNGSMSGGPGGSLTKIGSGTFTLSGANTYTGMTTVAEGQLIVAGSLTGTSGVTVEAGATLTVNVGATILLGNGSLTVDGTLTNNGTIRLRDRISAQRYGNTFKITFNGETGHTYQFQGSSSLDPNSFVDIGSSQPGDSQNVLIFTDPNATGSKGFYRILVSP